MKNTYFIFIFILTLLFSTKNSKAQNASYNYNTSTGTEGTTYSWIDCSGGTEITSWTGNADDGTASINWPFDFSFYDDNYTTSNSLSIGTNGFIRLDGTASTSYNDAINYDLTSTATSFGQIIALCVYDANFTDANSHLYYLTTGDYPNRIFTIEYDNVELDYDDGLFVSTQVSFYESSNKIVLKLGGDNINKSGVDMGLHSGVNNYYNKWQEVLSGTNDTWIEYTVPAKVFNGITYNQASTADVSPGQTNAEILRLDFDVSGGTGTITLNSIQITAVNTSDADIASSGVKLYQTTSTTFSTTNQLGTAQSLSSSSATFSSLNYSLPSGTTYIWAVYDIASGATRNNTVDMSIGAGDINVDGSTYPSSSESPTGDRTINYKEWDGSVDTDWRNSNNWTPSGVPSNSDNIVIPSSPANQPHLYDGDAGECNNIMINSGATMTVDNTGEMDIYGDIDNEGTLATVNYEIWLYGSNNFINGSGVFTSFRAQVKSGNKYTLLHNINCSRFRVDDGGGTLSIGDYILDCSSDFNDNPNSSGTSSATTNINNGTLSVAGVVTLDGTFNAGTGTFVYNGDNSQAIVNKTYYNLKIKVSTGTRTLTNVSSNMQNLEITGSGTASLDANINIDGNIINGTDCTIDQNNHTINFGGNWTNNGTFTQGTQTVTLDGSSAQTIGGSSTTTFYNLTANNSSEGITLNKTVNVSNTLTLTSGIINTTSSNLLIFGTAATAFSGGSNTSHIDGPVQKDGSSDFVFPTGDDGKYARIGISSLSGSDSFTAEYHKVKPTDNENYDYPITKVSDNEYWDLNRSSATASVTMYWEDSKWSGIGSFSELKIMRYGTKWIEESGTYSNSGSVDLDNPVAGSLSVTSVSNFGAFTFGTTHNLNNTLPISLLEFNAKAKTNRVILDWKTASEKNNDYFIIERSKNGIDIEQIGIVNGAGNSNELLNYSFIDDSPLKGISYYRLTQVDFNGESKSFDWKMISFIQENESEIFLFPNPISHDNLNIEMHNIIGKTQIKIFDNSCRLVYDKEYLVNTEMQKITVPIYIPKGVYFVQMINSKKSITKKLLVN